MLKKTILDARALIQTKKNQMDAIRNEISKLVPYPLVYSALPLIRTYFHQKNLTQLLQIVIYLCEVVACNLLFMEYEREFIPEMKEAIASLCYVGAKYSELPNLQKLRSQFATKYGEKFIASLAEFGVNKQVISLFVVPEPLVEEQNKLLKEIATQFNINWNPPVVLKFGCDCGCDCACCRCCK